MLYNISTVVWVLPGMHDFTNIQRFDQYFTIIIV